MDISAKALFLQNDFVPLLSGLAPETKGKWGKLNAQQMIEHFADAYRIASGRMENLVLLTSEEHLGRMQLFLRSDKPFRENTKSALMPDEPMPLRYLQMSDAIAELKEEANLFFACFNNQDNHTTLNPFFGWLNYADNIHLLYKHALHHLVQFGLWEYVEGHL